MLFLRIALPALLFSCAGAQTVDDSENEKAIGDALNQALADERLAEDTYEAVIEEHGAVRPFTNVIKAERRHQKELLALFRKYDIPIPPRTKNSVLVPATVEEACRMAIESEIHNSALYDELIESVRRSDVREVFERLQEASVSRHLPAFSRCLKKKQAASR